MGQRIRLLRTTYGMGVNEFARHCKMTRQGIKKLEDDEVESPHKQTIQDISDAFGSNPAWILYEMGQMLPNGKIELPLVPSNDPYENALIKRLMDEADFYKELLRNLTGKKSFLKVLKQSGTRAAA